MAQPAVQFEELRAQLKQLQEEREAWLAERARLSEELETLRQLCGQPQVERVQAWTQTEESDAAGAGDPAGGRMHAVLEKMRLNPLDEAVQQQGIEALFAEQTQVDNTGKAASNTRELRSSMEAAVAIFGNHVQNRALILKATQFLSVLLAEPDAAQQLPLAALQQAGQAAVEVALQLVEETGVAASFKLLTWLMSLLIIMLPALSTRLREQGPSEIFVRNLVGRVITKLLANDQLPQEGIVQKAVQLIPLLPMEPWSQKVCVESGLVHGLSHLFHKTAGGPGGSQELLQVISTAVRGVFADNPELCARALSDLFVLDRFVCLEVLEQIQAAERKRRGFLRELDADWGIVGKALLLWQNHMRLCLEDPEPERSPSRAVLQKAAELIEGVLLRLTPAALAQRMEEFPEFEPLQRLALLTIHSNAQLRLQLAVNYLNNRVIPILVNAMQVLLRPFQEPAESHSADVSQAFRLLRSGGKPLPPDSWTYLQFGLEICQHILSHWSATKSLRSPEEGVDSTAAPVVMAEGGLVDLLIDLLDAEGANLSEAPPADLSRKATEMLQALFEQNSYLSLFCMKQFPEVKSVLRLGCDSLALNPLSGQLAQQQEAVEYLAEVFEKVAASDERLARRILRTLAALFESSYSLVAWFVQQHPVSRLGELQSLNVHAEAVKAVSRAGYWSSEDAPLLPGFASALAVLIQEVMQGCVFEAAKPPKRSFDLSEAEEVVAGSAAAVLHLLLIDPSPPTILNCLIHTFEQADSGSDLPRLEDPDALEENPASGKAVTAVMKVMQVFPSSDRVQLSCQHLLSMLLGD